MNGLTTCEICSRTFDAAGGRKEAARKLGVSVDMINRWCEPLTESGKRNPVDRVVDLVAMQIVAGETHLAEETLQKIAAPLTANGHRLLILNRDQASIMEKALR